MADRVTCCPHCSTSFRISDAQLQTAKGAVRCGSCLQIFRALDHLLPQPGQQAQPAAAEQPSPAPQESAEPQPESTPQPPAEKPEPPAEAEQSALDTEEPIANHEEPLASHEEPSAVEPEDASTHSIDSTESDDEDEDEDADRLTQQDSIFTSDDEEEDFDIHSTTYNRALFSLESDGETDEDDEPEADIDFELEDDVLISDDMDRKNASETFSLGQLSDDFLDTSSDKQQQSSLFDRKQKKTKNLETEASDESWAEEMLQEMESELTDSDSPEKKVSAEDEYYPEGSGILKTFGGTYLNEPSAKSPDTEDFDPEQPDPLFVKTPSLPADETGEYDRLSSGSFDTLDDDTIDSELGESFSTRREPLFTVTGDQDDFDESPAAASSKSQADNVHYDYAGDDSQRDDHDLLLQGIAPAPVEMDWHVETSPWPKRLLWGSLSLLAGLGLVAQLAYFNFEEYSRTQPWRQAYASLCPILGCELPSLSDPRQVKAYNLVVRSNPDTKGALIIDSILLNTASFDQPFPDFALTFSNLQGKQVAYRRFTPREYLGGELAGATSMPSGQPVHISLEVVDPGPDAVNYTATIPNH
ncbi:DUF3426 domain-containing protein [Aestuariicella sp. G3-2]|uniref:DUF3426 domain-containing protein n=1 Tax=Pseudomaricurvus albidus TaxID=2842452 RepID=UPI001C0C02BC|nr:DUF3426 domain-containing protein [Aestuariicella albida]MBU3069101.1 DUF3426 domain-containing protein [Aestuariicella albida]